MSSRAVAARAEIHVVTIPYHKRVTWEGGSESEATYVVLRLIAGNGAEGLAECTAKPSWNGFDAETLVLALRRLLLPALTGCDLADGAAVAALFRKLPENSAAKALVENARADLVAGMNPSVPRASAIPVSWTLTRDTPDRMAAEAVTMMERFGFRTLKLKGGQGLAADLAAMRAIVKTGDGAISVYVDVNGAGTPEDAGAYLTAMAEAGAIGVEDPYNLKPTDALSRVQRDSPVPVIVDFSLDGVSSAASFLERGVAGLSLKPTRMGLNKTARMAALAEAHGAIGVVGLFGESQAGAVHLLDAHAALPPGLRVLPAEASFHLTLREHYLKVPLAIVDGAIGRPDAPNLAALVDWPRLSAIGGELAHAVRL